MNHFTFPLIPVLTNDNQKFFMHSFGAPPVQTVEVEGIQVFTAPLAFDKAVNLLELSRDQGLVNVGFQDDTDSVAPGVTIGAVYLAHPTKGVLKATAINSKPADGAFAPAKGSEFSRLLRINRLVRFGMVFDTNEHLEFDLQLNGHVHLDTGVLMLTTDGKIQIMKQSTWCVREQPLFSFRPHGFEVKAQRINYNRRAAPAAV